MVFIFCVEINIVADKISIIGKIIRDFVTTSISLIKGVFISRKTNPMNRQNDTKRTCANIAIGVNAILDKKLFLKLATRVCNLFAFKLFAPNDFI